MHQTSSRREQKPTFERTIAQAIRVTTQQAQAELAEHRSLLRGWEQRLGTAELATDASYLETPARVVQREIRRLRDRAARRTKHLETFNIVLFGRTGAGKSSFVEALTRGDGRRISTRGLLDHTRDIEERRWRGLTVIDTPGIQGWAQSEERARIERLAQEAVERADVVFLAFDSYNQKIGEFKQIAQWVSRAGKAAVALLNVKDESWRFDEMLWEGDPRSLAVSQVRGHVEHVSGMLDEIGLPNVPVIALNTQWAVAARSRSLKAHPALEELQDALRDFGAARLEHVSNIEAVTDLLTAAVTIDARTLRLGGVRTEIAAVLERLAGELAPRRKQLKQSMEVMERQVEAGLKRTGFDPHPTPTRFADPETLAAARELALLVKEIWPDRVSSTRRRDSTELRQNIVRALEPRLAKLRNEGARRAHEKINDAFESRSSVDGQTLADAAISERTLRRNVERAVKGVFEDLAQDLDQDAVDACLEFDMNAGAFGFDSETGAGSRRLGQIGGYATVPLAGIGLLVGGPVILAVAGIGAAVLGVFSRKKRKQADRQIREHRAQVERELGQWMDRTLQMAKDAAIAAAHDSAAGLGARAFVGIARQWAEAKEQRASLGAIEREARRRHRALASSQSPQQVIIAARRAVEERRHPGEPGAPEKVWFGEDWLDEESGGSAVKPTPLYLPPRGDELLLPAAAAEEVDGWLDSCALRLPAGLTSHVDASRLLLNAPPEIVLVGDYSAGKTSLIRRLGAELSLRGTDDLPVGAGPTTNSIVRIDAGTFVIVDTPGLESERSEDEATARSAVAGGAIVAVVHSAASGDLATVTDVIRPAHAPERAERVIHVLGRIDALASRPHRNGTAFMRLLETKRAELAGRLQDRGLPCAADLPLPVAADPGGRHADVSRWMPESFTATRGWDGIEPLLRVLQRLAPGARGSAAVDTLVTALATEQDRLAGVKADIEANSQQVEPIVRLYARAQRDHKRLEGHSADRLRAMVDDYLTERAETLASASIETLEDVRTDPEAWFLDDDLNGRLDRWTAEVDERVSSIYADLELGVRTRTAKPAFAAAAKRMPKEDALRDVVEELKRQGVKSAPRAARAAMGKVPGAARHVKSVGPALGLFAGALLERAAQKADEAAAARHDKKLVETLNALRAAGQAWADRTLGSDVTPGVLDDLVATRKEHIDLPLAHREAMTETLRGRVSEIEAERAVLTTLITEGRALLVP